MKYFTIDIGIILLIASFYLWKNVETRQIALMLDFMALTSIFSTGFYIKTRFKYIFLALLPLFLGIIAQLTLYYSNENNSQFFTELIRQTFGKGDLTWLAIIFYIVAIASYLLIFKKDDYSEKFSYNLLKDFSIKLNINSFTTKHLF